jgi:hypothetical protein
MRTESTYDSRYIYATCSANALEEMTRDGWELVESFFEVTQDSHEVSREDVFPPEGSYAPPGTRVQHQLGIPMYMTLFLIRRERGEYDKVKVLEAGLESQRKSNGDLAKEIGNLKDELVRRDDELKRTISNEKYYSEQLVAKNETLGKMEGDIAKLRQHFGEKAVKEALSGKG